MRYMALVTLYYRRKDNTEDPEPPVIVESISIPVGPTTTAEDMKEVVKEDMKPPVIACSSLLSYSPTLALQWEVHLRV